MKKHRCMSQNHKLEPKKGLTLTPELITEEEQVKQSWQWRKMRGWRHQWRRTASNGKQWSWTSWPMQKVRHWWNEFIATFGWLTNIFIATQRDVTIICNEENKEAVSKMIKTMGLESSHGRTISVLSPSVWDAQKNGWKRGKGKKLMETHNECQSWKNEKLHYHNWVRSV